MSPSADPGLAVRFFAVDMLMACAALQDMDEVAALTARHLGRSKTQLKAWRAKSALRAGDGPCGAPVAKPKIFIAPPKMRLNYWMVQMLHATRRLWQSARMRSAKPVAAAPLGT